MEQLTLRFIKETSDIRGKILWTESNDTEMHLVEIKKGFSRGGHYHPFDSVHIIISGKAEYHELDLTTGSEIVKTVEPLSIISTPANRPHLLTAIEDVIFMESFRLPYKAVDYPPYRSIVEERMKRVDS